MVTSAGVNIGTITAFGSTTSLTVSTSQTIAAGTSYKICYPSFHVASTGEVGMGTSTPQSGYLLDMTKLGGAASCRLKGVSQATFEMNDGTASYIVAIAGGIQLRPSGTTVLAASSTGLTITDGLFIGSSSAKNIFGASSATTVVDFDINASSAANNTFFRLGNGTMSTASSGLTKIISSTPSINQSGTAGYTALNINVTETGTGSGAKNLVMLGVGGVEKFSIDNGGIVKASAQVRLKGYTVATLPTGTQGDTAFVTDALAPAFNVAVVNGGTVVTKVFYNGTAWIAG
jgi:hypothetical protein